ncbi:hypothetical protein [Xanthobacter agilis]|jgi:hypothetical protein|uniref:hypothetical protein n=1 Tax=Xanthobacter agilis TaxID=47492 RepID=UPI003728E223
MKNPKTGELKAIGMGWNWLFFLLGSFFGIPLFLYRLYLMGGVTILVNIASSIFMGASAADNPIGTLIGLGIQLAFLIYLGMKGNELIAKSLLDKGWIFAKPESPEAQVAMSNWKIEAPTARAF